MAYETAGGVACGVITFGDRMRADLSPFFTRLRALGLSRTVLLSGDHAENVRPVAESLGITEARGDLLPDEKVHAVKALEAEGRRVLMVGDGLNDTAALAGAHVSISPASALDAARTASDIVLLGQDLAPLSEAVRIAVAARRRIKQNFALSLAYNLVAVPVALVGLATPLIAALAMSTSSITVSLNALRLR